MDVSKNGGTPKSSILIGISIINHPFWGTPIFGNTHIVAFFFNSGVTCRSRRWNILGMVGIECVLPHSGENSDFEGMSELFAWIYGDQM